LARKYNVSRNTIYKWKSRESIEDASHAPIKHGQQRITDSDIQLIITTRQTTNLPLDDLHEVIKTQISFPISRSQLSKVLQKHGLTNQKSESNKGKGKFIDYEPGYVHVDCTYLPKIGGQQSKAFCAIDRKTKWAYVEIHEQKTKEASEAFLENLIKACPLKIHSILTDNGAEFTYEGLSEKYKTKKKHPFDAVCERAEIKHIRTKYRHPWTNGQVERFNGQLKSGTTKSCRYATQKEMEESIKKWVMWYNEECKLKSLRRLSPNEAIRKYHEKCIENNRYLPNET
jgi:transposase-like protein